MAALEREYNVPLRREFQKAPIHRRAKKATKAMKEFLAHHMKAEFENIKLSKWVNQEIWLRGIKHPPHHVKVKAIKDDKGIVQVELAVLPKPAVEEKKQQEAKKQEKKKEEKKEKEEKQEKTEEKAEENKEKTADEIQKEKEAKEKDKMLHTRK